MTNCGYYGHDFKPNGPIKETWLQSLFTNDKEYSFIQEMVCSKCGISTYYHIEDVQGVGP